MFLPVRFNTETLDHWLERILFIRPAPDISTGYKASKVFGFALVISATRCIFQYVLLPFVLPFMGVVGQAPVWLSLLLSSIAFISLVTSLRRFWQAKHPRRFAYLPLALLMFVVLIVFVLSDLKFIQL
jgi:hypothetical protein